MISREGFLPSEITVKWIVHCRFFLSLIGHLLPTPPQPLSCHVFFLSSRTNGNRVCSILASPLRYMRPTFSIHVFAWNSDIDLRDCSGVFCEVWVFFLTIFHFFDKILQTIWQTFWRFQHARHIYPHMIPHMICFACALNHNLLIGLPSFSCR